MKRIVIFGGTTEGRELAEALAGKPLSLTVCVATEYGREEQGELPGVEVHSGRLDAAAMAVLLKGADLCVDATHPYAKEVSKNIRTACGSSGTPYRRLLRKTSPLPETAVKVDSAKAAAEYLKDKPGNVLLTTGSKELASYEGLERQRLFPRVLPGISSVQLLSARLLRPWQDWNLVSAHGTDCSVVAEVIKGKPTFFLTGGKDTGVQALCARLTQAGLGDLPITVGEQLSYPEEKITRGTARELAGMSFQPLAVMLAEPAPTRPRRCPGYPDSAFTRGEVPMTKQEVRASVLSKLAVRPGDILWDVGAGTGSVSVEMALAAPQGEVYAVECNPEGCALIAQNREKFAAWNLHIVEGRAPEALEVLPAPDAVFLGGTKGAVEPILRCAVEKNPQVRICISAIALETLSQAIGALNTLGYRVEVSQIAVSRSKGVGKLHLLMANNPVFLITGEKDD